jgi:hypothetical protein
MKLLKENSNLIVNALLLVSAALKVFQLPFLTDAVENVFLIGSSIAALINIISKVEWKSITWSNWVGNSQNSTNFFIQAYGFLVSLLPFLAAYISEGDFISIFDNVLKGNWAGLGSLMVVIALKLFSKKADVSQPNDTPKTNNSL